MLDIQDIQDRISDDDCVRLFHAHAHPADAIIESLLDGTSLDAQAETEADARDASEQAEQAEPVTGKPSDIEARLAHYREQLATCEASETPMEAYAS